MRNDLQQRGIQPEDGSRKRNRSGERHSRPQESGAHRGEASDWPCAAVYQDGRSGKRRVDRFDAKHGVAFKSYAQHRILGAMLDHSAAMTRSPARSEAEFGASTGSAKGFVPQSGIADRLGLADARRFLTPRENFVVAMLFDRDRPAREVARSSMSMRAACRRSSGALSKSSAPT